MPILAAFAVLAALAWIYLLICHGRFWLTRPALPAPGGAGVTGEASPGHPQTAANPWPSVVAVIPSRNEAPILPVTLPSLLGQQYPGEFRVVVVDDGSTDGTAQAAAKVARELGGDLRVTQAGEPPPGWAGKVNAMARGVVAAGECDYFLFTDADIAYQPGTLEALVRAATDTDRALVSQMALLRAQGGWERIIVPAFVYFFAQLYPFRRVGRPGSRTAAAAGGCMLVRAASLTAAGGLARICGARIDDVALGRLLKGPPVRARCWLGFTRDVRSVRPYPGLVPLWDMVARSAYTQLRYSPALLAVTLVGLTWLYLLPPAAALTGLAALAAGAGSAAAWCAAAGLAGWAVMTVTFLPVLRLYRLAPWRALSLPVVALLYAAMTADSAWRHYAGRGGEWKGRVASAPARD